VTAEDLPESIAAALPGIEYLTQISLEGRAPQYARAQLGILAKRLAQLSHGVLHNPQDGTLTTPAGVKRLPRYEKGDIFSILSMSWWFLGGQLADAEGFGRMVALFEGMLPEALPRRYGDFEPPQFTYAVTGRAHFISWCGGAGQSPVRSMVWYPSPPVLSVSPGLPNPAGPSRRGFRSNFLSIAFELAALQQPGWHSQVRRVWIELSRLIQPFFGDVRALNGYRRGRGTYACDAWTEHHPVTSWWWCGVPRDLGNAVVLGEEYQRLWPAFAATADMSGRLAFRALPDWSVKSDLAEQLGGVPDEIAMAQARPTAGLSPHGILALSQMPRAYPTKWPFDGPFASGT